VYIFDYDDAPLLTQQAVFNDKRIKTTTVRREQHRPIKQAEQVKTAIRKKCRVGLSVMTSKRTMYRENKNLSYRLENRASALPFVRNLLTAN